jgi:hypothetical protein
VRVVATAALLVPLLAARLRGCVAQSERAGHPLSPHTSGSGVISGPSLLVRKSAGKDALTRGELHARFGQQRVDRMS